MGESNGAVPGVRAMRIEGAYVYTPQSIPDERGEFRMVFHRDRLAELTGHPLPVAQANLSVSRRGVLRGIHFADVPPGQAKYLTCVKGAVLDVTVDIRVGSPTFGAWDAVRLDERSGNSVYLAEGLGHGFYALTDGAAVSYFCSEPYNPRAEHTVHPLDPAIGIAWPDEVPPVLSPRDAAAISLDEAREAGILPDYERCRQFYADARSRAPESGALTAAWRR